MPQRNRRDGRHAIGRTRLLSAVAIALAGHALLLAGIAGLVTRGALDAGVPADPLELAQLADVLMPESAPLADGVVIQAVDEPSPEPPPPETPHVAEHDHNPERETVKRGGDRAPRVLPPISEQAQTGPVRADDPRPAPGAPAAVSAPPVAAELPRVPEPLSSLPVPPLPEPTAPTTEPGPSPSAGSRADAGAPVLAAGAPPPLPRPTVGGTQAEEMIPDIAPGDETAIRARASARARYQNGIRQKVQDMWRAQDAYKQASGRGMLDGRALESLVIFRVGADGSVEKAQLAQGSGIGPLDEEAVAVFGRAAPFERPPPEILDDRGGLQFPVRFTVLEDMATFQARARRAIRERWRPSPAFSRAGDRERITVAKLLLTTQGVLTRAQLISSAGIEFLDQGAMAALAAGLRLPDPPHDYALEAGLVPLVVEFRHTVKRPPPDVRVLKPSEQPRTR